MPLQVQFSLSTGLATHYRELPKRKSNGGTPVSDPGIPGVALILPVAPLPFTDMSVSFDQLDAHDVFRHLIAELALDTKADRSAVCNREDLVVHLVGEDGLRMHGLRQIDTLIVFCVRIAALHRIGTVKHRVSRGRLWLDLTDDFAERHPLPLADAAPALDTVMAGDLGA